jgi:hypothetical protein
MLRNVSISKALIRSSLWYHKFSYWTITLATIHNTNLMFYSAPAECDSAAKECNSTAAEWSHSATDFVYFAARAEYSAAWVTILLLSRRQYIISYYASYQENTWHLNDFLDAEHSSLPILVFSQHAEILGWPVLAAQWKIKHPRHTDQD